MNPFVEEDVKRILSNSPGSKRVGKVNDKAGKEDIVRQTAAQLIRDFEIAGETISFSGNTAEAYAELSEQIRPIIKKLLETDLHRLSALFYRMGMDENKIHQVLSDTPSLDTSSVLSDRIIEHELRKVILRSVYSRGMVPLFIALLPLLLLLPSPVAG